MTDPQEKHAPANEHERRALDNDEMEMADQARNPALGSLSDSALSDLVSRLRSRRNRARDISDRQGREARAKAAPSGTSAASSNAGTMTKHEFLNAALERAMKERELRQAKKGGKGDAEDSDAPTQEELSAKALESKQQAETEENEMKEDGGALHPHDPDASSGKRDLKNTERNTAPAGALDHAGELPSRERSRTRY
ncbi:MAG: hypothetical protein ACNA7O_05575 [Rhodobacterales bacterium]